MVRNNRRSASVRLGIERLETRTVLSGAPIHVDTFLDVVDPGDGVTSLREAIVQARENPGDDRIHLPKGNYALDAAFGQLEINDPNGRLRIESAGAAIDAGAQASRVLHISESDVQLKGLTITGGRSFTGFPFGGGILSEASTLKLKNSQVTGNMAVEAGGIANVGGTLLVMNSTVSNNCSEGPVVRTGNGGGIGNFNGSLTIINSEVINNQSHNTGNTSDSIVGGVGGGIISVGTPNLPGPPEHSVVVLNSSVSGNTVNGRGGGIAIFSSFGTYGFLTLINSTVANNSAVDTLGTAVRNGGGILVVTDVDTPGFDEIPPDATGGINHVTLIRTRVTHNLAGNDGGGMWIGERDSVMLVLSRVSENEAGNNGGGILNRGSLTSVLSSVTDNVAGNDGDDIVDA